jgi:hypothetical protein
MEQHYLAGSICILIGLLYCIFPSTIFQFRTFIAQKLFDVHIQAGKRTYLAYRIIGIAFVLFGTSVLLR